MKNGLPVPFSYEKDARNNQSEQGSDLPRRRRITSPEEHGDWERTLPHVLSIGTKQKDGMMKATDQSAMR